MKSIEFQKFIDLVTFDQSLVKIEHDIERLQDSEKSLLLDIQRLHDDFLDIKHAKDQAHKAVDEKELYMKVLDVKESELKEKLQSISNQKEYKSLSKELAVINEQRLQHEQILLTLWNKYEVLQKGFDARNNIYNDEVATLNSGIESLHKNIADLRHKLTDLENRRESHLQGVPQEWVDMYVNMKGRVENPVVPVVSESCDACFYSVTPRDMQTLRQNKLLQCRDCYRLLYLENDSK